MNIPLTHERAERLRQPVTIQQMWELDARIISGKSETVNGEVRGSLVLRAVPSRNFDHGIQFWRWRDDGPPTLTDRELLRDWPGISNGDPVTWGHLEALGVTA